MKRFGHITIICLFLGFIYLPLFLSIIQEDKEVSQSEKRKLARLPFLELNLKSLTDFPDGFEKYYNDHFGLREKFVLAYNFLYFKILRKSNLPSVTVGPGEWLFYNSEGVLLDYLGLMQHQPDQYEIWKRTLEDRQEWFVKQGILYLFAVAPSKMMIYPEKLPDRVRKKAGTPVLDELEQYLAKSSTFTGYVDLRSDLLEAKQKQQVYFRTDTHWNPDGAYVAYLSIMERIKEWFPDVRIVPQSSLKKNPSIHSGDICISMNLANIISEEADKTEISPACTTEDYVKMREFVHPNSEFAGNANYLPIKNGCKGNPVKALIIHDSFGLFLRPYFNETFGEVIYSHYVDLKDLKGLIKTEKPDVVIDVRTARNLYGMLEEDPELDRSMLAKRFAQSTDVLLRLNAENGFSSLMETHDADIVPDKDGFLVDATGNDPFLVLSFDTGVERGPLMAEVSITSPRETMMQVFYTTEEEKSFASSRQVSVKLTKGKSSVLFRLPHPETAGKIRLDPGIGQGEYKLHSLIIKREQ